MTGYKDMPEPVVVLGYSHHPACFVARHPVPGTWETSGFPWCSCPRGFRAVETARREYPRSPHEARTERT